MHRLLCNFQNKTKSLVWYLHVTRARDTQLGTVWNFVCVRPWANMRIDSKLFNMITDLLLELKVTADRNLCNPCASCHGQTGRHVRLKALINRIEWRRTTTNDRPDNNCWRFYFSPTLPSYSILPPTSPSPHPSYYRHCRLLV